MPYDKKLHFAAGFIISLIGGIISTEYAIFLPIVAGIAKELYDLLDYGKYDYKDMLATWAGGAAGCLILFI